MPQQLNGKKYKRSDNMPHDKIIPGNRDLRVFGAGSNIVFREKETKIMIKTKLTFPKTVA